MWPLGGVLLLWFLLRPKKKKGQAGQPVALIEGEASEAAAASEEQAYPEPDDLTCVSGIGPVSAEVLQKNGIRTLAQLAAADVDHLKAILAREGLPRIINPSKWPARASGI